MHPDNVIQPDRAPRAGGPIVRRSSSRWWPLLAAFSLVFVAACGGGGGGNGGGSGGGGDNNGDTAADESATTSVAGSATKGPLANADVTVFALDTGEDDLRGRQIATGTTTGQAQFNVDLPDDTNGRLLVLIEANVDTIDLATGVAPVLSRLTTIIDAADWLEGDPVYATPLSHMAVEIARQNIGGNADASPAQVRSALAQSQRVVRETVGSGLLVDSNGDPIDLFSTPPTLTNGSTDAEGRNRTLRYRKASENLTAMLAEIAGSTEQEEIEGLFDTVADDLADGKIDGKVDPEDNASENLADAFTGIANPGALTIPNDPENRTVDQTREVLNAERDDTGADDEGVDDLADGEDDAGPQAVTADSGLTSTELVGEVATLTLTASPAGAATMTTTGGDEVGDGVFEFALGADDEASVSVTSAQGYEFRRWREDGGAEQSTDGEYAFSVETDIALVAEHAVQLTLQADPVTGGSPAADGAGQFFEPGIDVVQADAFTANGFEFDAWAVQDNGMFLTPPFMGAQETDDPFEGDNPVTFNMPSEPTVLVALYNFAAVTEPDPAQGTVESTFDDAGNLLLTAAPVTGFQFVRWVDEIGGELGTQREDFLVDPGDLNENSTITAEFEEAPLKGAVWGEFDWGDALWQ